MAKYYPAKIKHGRTRGGGWYTVTILNGVIHVQGANAKGTPFEFQNTITRPTKTKTQQRSAKIRSGNER